MIGNCTITAAVFLSAVLLASPTVHAQEISVLGILGRSSNDHLGDPSGAGVQVTWYPIRFVGARFEYSRAGSSARWTDTTCEAYWPIYSDCLEEVVRNEVDFESYDWALVIAPLRARGWRAEAWIGISNADFRYAIRGVETGRLLDRGDLYPETESDDPIDIFDHNTTSWGLGVAREGLAGLPVVLGLEWSRRNPPDFVCPTDSYCPSWAGEVHLDEFRLHLGWSIKAWQWDL